MDAVLFSHNKDEWNTPKDLLEKLDHEFSFDFDPCPENHTFNGLELEWGTRNFVNPLYSEWQEWVKKGYAEYLKGKLVVFLLPARTCTKAFHNYCMRANEIRFIKGRLKFGESKNSAPFPSMIVVFNPKDNGLAPRIKSF